VSQPYVGEIRMFAGNFAPAGWLFCEGQLLPISEYETLFNLIGTTYGGDGQSTFALPDLRGRMPIHQGNGFTFAQSGGEESVTLNVTQIPSHTHVVQAQSGAGGQASLSNAFWAEDSGATLFAASPTANSVLSSSAIGNAGSSQPHENHMPYLAVSFIISLFGVFPSPT
jgi:microcystin-dependent protein